jgi:RNA polymerase sigma-70 factor, ECF subfamily
MVRPSPENVDPTDDELVDRLRVGDERALALLIDRFYARLVSFASIYLRTRIPGGSDAEMAAAAAEEVVHDAFVQLWRQRSAVRIRSTPAAYLFGVTRNRALTHIDRMVRSEAQRRRLLLHAEESQEVPGMGWSDQPSTEIERSEQWEALYAAIDALPAGRREVLLLRWREGMSFAEIADALGISIRSAETQHLRAMNDLRRKLRPGESEGR